MGFVRLHLSGTGVTDSGREGWFTTAGWKFRAVEAVALEPVGSYEIVQFVRILGRFPAGLLNDFSVALSYGAVGAYTQ